jgi:hypothetical protein
MSTTTDVPTRGPARPGPYIVSGVLLLVGVVGPLLIPVYARLDPQLFGLPFFYWFQMLWVFIDAALLWIVYKIVIREDNRRRETVRALRDAQNGDDTEVGK